MVEKQANEKEDKMMEHGKKALQTDLRELSGRLGRCGRAVVDRAVSVCGVCPSNVAHAQTHQKTTKLLRAFLTNPILITKSITIERFVGQELNVGEFLYQTNILLLLQVYCRTVC